MYLYAVFMKVKRENQFQTNVFVLSTVSDWKMVETARLVQFKVQVQSSHPWCSHYDPLLFCSDYYVSITYCVYSVLCLHQRHTCKVSDCFYHLCGAVTMTKSVCRQTDIWSPDTMIASLLVPNTKVATGTTFCHDDTHRLTKWKQLNISVLTDNKSYLSWAEKKEKKKRNVSAKSHQGHLKQHLMIYMEPILTSVSDKKKSNAFRWLVMMSEYWVSLMWIVELIMVRQFNSGLSALILELFLARGLFGTVSVCALLSALLFSKAQLRPKIHDKTC